MLRKGIVFNNSTHVSYCVAAVNTYHIINVQRRTIIIIIKCVCKVMCILDSAQGHVRFLVDSSCGPSDGGQRGPSEGSIDEILITKCRN